MPERIILSVDAGATHCRLQLFAFMAKQLKALGPAAKFGWDFSSLVSQTKFRNSPIDSELSGLEQHAGELQIGQLVNQIVGYFQATGPATGSRLTCILAWPGIKNATADSIIRCANGARIENLTGRVQAELCASLNHLASVIVLPLVSDGTMAGWGEWSHPEGGLYQQSHGYLMMAGTGLAEAFVISGQVWGRIDLKLPGAFDIPRGVHSFEHSLNGRAWSEDSSEQISSAVVDWMALRREHFVERNLPQPQRLVLGGRSSAQLLSPLAIQDLQRLGYQAVFSRLQDPALWGAAYFASQASPI